MKSNTAEFNFLDAINGALQEASEAIKKNKQTELAKQKEQAEKDKKTAAKIINAMVPGIKKALITHQLTIPVYPIPPKDLAQGKYSYSNSVGDHKTSQFPRMIQDVPDALIGVSRFVYDGLVEQFHNTLAEDMVMIGMTHPNGDGLAFEIRLEFKQEQVEQGTINYEDEDEDRHRQFHPNRDNYEE